MNEQKDKPMPNIAFRFMSFAFKLRDRFVNPKKVLEKVDVREGQTVLDFGCGPGSYTIPAAKLVGEKGRVIALDIQPLAIKAVEKKAKKEKLTNITTILSNSDANLPAESVDVVLLYDIIHMIKDKRALLKELHRVIKSGSVLSILVGHIKVDSVLEIVNEDNLFVLRNQNGKLLNFEKRS